MGVGPQVRSRAPSAQCAGPLAYEDALLYLLAPGEARSDARLYKAFGGDVGFRTLSEYRAALGHLAT